AIYQKMSKAMRLMECLNRSAQDNSGHCARLSMSLDLCPISSAPIDLREEGAG
ncbi:hypothetical protein AARAC_004485, partial [Aspergillus arachidicola]